MKIATLISLRGVLLAACAGFIVVTAQAADVPQPPATRNAVSAAQTAPVRHARVAQDGQVELAAQTSDAELAAMRPHYQDLKPRVRTNTE